MPKTCNERISDFVSIFGPMQSESSDTQAELSRGWCEGCEQVKQTLKENYEFQCGGPEHEKLCEECRNLQTCPIHEWAHRHPE